MRSNVDPVPARDPQEQLRHHRRRHGAQPHAHGLFRHRPRLHGLLHRHPRPPRPDAGAGAHHAHASGLLLRRHDRPHAPLRGPHGARRHLHLQRSLRRRRHAPARHLHRQADLLRGQAVGLGLLARAPLRCRRHRRRLQRALRPRDLPGRPAHPLCEVHRGRQARAGHLGHGGDQRAPARQGDGRPAVPARRLRHRRARADRRSSSATASPP